MHVGRWRLIGRTAAASAAAALVVALATARAQVPPSPDARWLYVVDANGGAFDTRVLVVDAQEGRLVSSFAAGHHPDVALSPDGGRLYVASTVRAPDDNHLAGVLEIIDTATGATLRREDNPNRWLSTLPLYSSQMAVSHDGRWLFQAKMTIPEQDHSVYYVDTFDTRLNAFLPGRALVPACVTSVLLPSPRKRQELGVLCSHTQDVRMLELAADGSLPAARTPRISLASRVGHDHTGTAFFSDGGQSLTVIAPDGRFARAAAASKQVLQTGVIDRAARRVREQDDTAFRREVDPLSEDADDWLVGRRVRQQAPVLSPDGSRLYVGVDRLANRRAGRHSFDEVAVLDGQRLERRQTIRLRQPVWSIALGKDGRRLYGVDPRTATLVVLDALTGEELRVISGLGATPIFAVAAPAGHRPLGP